MKRLPVFAMVVAVVISRTVGEMELSEITLSVSGVERNYTAKVYQAEDTELNWSVNGSPVVISFIDTVGGNPDLANENDPIIIMDETLYGFSYEVSGMNVTSTLTIKKEAGYGDVMINIKNANRAFLMTSIVGAKSTVADGVPTTVASTSALPTKKIATMYLSEITMTKSEAERNYTGTVHHAARTDLNWKVNRLNVVSASINVNEDGSLNLTDPINAVNITDENLYGFSFEISGTNVTTTLTIKTEKGYDDVMLVIGTMNSSLPMTSISTSADGTVKPMTSTDGKSVATTSDGTVKSMTSTDGMSVATTSDGTVKPMTSTDGMSVATTADGSVKPMTSTVEMSVSTTSDGTVKPMTSIDEMLVSTTSDGTAITRTSMDGMPSSTTRESMALPDCDVGGQKCTESTVFNCSREVTMEPCTVSYQCKNDRYAEPNITCEGKRVCISPGVWGVNCGKLCGQGCPMLNSHSAIHICDVTTGRCLNNVTNTVLEREDCVDGWKGDGCEIPQCDPQDCNGGVCLAPNFCGNCRRHYESGVTCRNISLDGFSKGSLPTLVILAAVIIILKFASDCYDRTKKKSN